MRYFNGSLVKQYRESRGINGAWLCRQIGMSRTMLHYIEKGERQLGLNKYIKLCDALGVSLELFISPIIGIKGGQ